MAYKKKKINKENNKSNKSMYTEIKEEISVSDYEECEEYEEYEYAEVVEQQDYELNNYNNNIFEPIYYFTFKLTNYVSNIIRWIIGVSGVYIMWILFHYGASHLYIYFCVPNTIYGVIISPFLTATPQCQGLRWIVYNGANIINNMWVILGSWLISNIF